MIDNIKFPFLDRKKIQNNIYANNQSSARPYILQTPIEDKYISRAAKRGSRKNLLLKGSLLTSAAAATAVLAGIKTPKGFVKLSTEEIKFLKTKLASNTAHDIEYLNKIAQGITSNLNIKGKIESYRLTSIVGSDELKSILPTLKKENYLLGENFINVQNGVYQANFHMHTNISDGTMNISELMNQAAQYADKVHAKTGKKFTIAITDHESIEGNKEAVKLIAQDPMKYKNLRVVLGMEKGFATPSPYSYYGNPTETSEVIGYSINPFCPKLNKFLNTLKQNRENLINTIIEKANKLIPDANFSIEESGLISKTHPKSIMMDTQWEVSNYLKAKAKGKDEIINNLCRDFRPGYDGKQITFQTPYKTENTLDEIIDVMKDSNEGFLGLAHPAFLKTKGFESAENIVRHFKQKGGDIAHSAEIYYQDYNSLTAKQIEDFHNFCLSEKLTPTTGLDNHSNNIFTPNKHKGDLSKETLDLLLQNSELRNIA